MTTRRFNYTGAQKIKQSDVEIVLDRDGDDLAFDASYNLASYRMPETAEVVIEAYADWTVMRFLFGTIGMKHTPDSLVLTDFDYAEGIRFRLKVLGTGDQSGMILAEADKIRPSDLTESEDARSFVVVRPVDLGSVVWRMVFDEAQPVLQINERLGDWRSFLRRGPVRSMIVPEVLRQILREAIADVADDDDTDSWSRNAMKLATASAGSQPRVDDEDDVERWIDEVVRKFAHRHRLWRGVTEFVTEDDEP